MQYKRCGILRLHLPLTQGAATERSVTMDERRTRHLLAQPMSDLGAEGEVNHEERIRRLELEARPLDPGAEERIRLRDKVVTYADAFMESLASRPALDRKSTRLNSSHTVIYTLSLHDALPI